MVFHLGKLLWSVSQSAYKNISVARKMSTAKLLIYDKHGEPASVLQIKQSELKEPEKDEVTVKWLLSPVNPADINTIQGRYPIKPTFPSIPGNEGVGEIIAVGSQVKGFSVGDKIVPGTIKLGTWRTCANYKPDEIIKIPKEFGTVEASMFIVNPCTAYRMLKDFVKLNPGDTVIQNGANSAVGQLVIQLCKVYNFHSVNVVRDRPNIQELKNQLKTLGADEVLTEAEVRTTQIFKNKQLPLPKLACNCVCGQNALDVLRHLAHGGIMVTYGGMSREPLTIPASALIFKDLTFKGFWMTAWSETHKNTQEKEDMYKDLAALFIEKKLQCPPYKIIPFSQYQEAMVNTLKTEGKQGVKYILDLTKS
ncbi:enoyl-[acyl-carrier-protein] reductase, mitochondrial [Prorops nasuta]|uniref:enoyl-[acyl-carrier-protein] reductase, mitochondrial n=1 Tax=Prorops nasuta TaxID=863751 RepID=UPI0034CE57B0